MTKLPEPVQVGQTWKNKKGEVYKIASMCENGINFFGGGLTSRKGFTDFYTRVAPMCECSKNNNLQDKTALVTKEASSPPNQETNLSKYKDLTSETPCITKTNQETPTNDDFYRDFQARLDSVNFNPAPTQFERIFTAVLPSFIKLGQHEGYNIYGFSEEKVREAIYFAQEAIKQLKEIEVGVL